jgi:hypothetical protein
MKHFNGSSVHRNPVDVSIEHIADENCSNRTDALATREEQVINCLVQVGVMMPCALAHNELNFLKIRTSQINECCGL